jgi:N-acetylneuraminate lyase
LAAIGVAGVFVAGSTGEGQSLTVDERMRLAECWVEVAPSLGLQVVVQVGDNCVADAVRLAAHAQELRAHAISSSPPCYFKPPTVADLVDVCVPIAAAAAQLPFYYYDIPLLTHVQLSMVEFLRLGRAKLPNLVGLKYTNSDLMQLQECLRLDDGAHEILFGFDEILLAAYALGVRGAVGSTYNFAAPLYHRLVAAFDRGDLATARACQAQSVTLIRRLQAYGFSAAAKTVMSFLGIDCGPVRPPLRNLTPEQCTALRRDWDALDLK